MGNNKRPADDSGTEDSNLSPDNSGAEDYDLSPDEQEEVDGRDNRPRYWYENDLSKDDTGSIRVRSVTSYDGCYSQSSDYRVGLKMF